MRHYRPIFVDATTSSAHRVDAPQRRNNKRFAPMMMLCVTSSSTASATAAKAGCRRYVFRATLATSSLTRQQTNNQQIYQPTLSERRPGEAGPGGRSSEAGIKVAVFGARGQLGHYLAGHLGANGFMTYVGNRGDEDEMRHLKMSFDLGRLRYAFYSPRDIDSIKHVIADADVVVNLIGKYYETGQPVATAKFPYIKYEQNYSFYETNVTIAQTIAQVCKDLQTDHLIHVSSASASPYAKSEWSRTKYQGEQAVKDIFPWATIIRPTQMFSKQDHFLHWFARCAQWFRCVPLVHGGRRLTMPVWAGNVAETILKVCDAPTRFEGRQIDCFGPAEFTYREMADFVDDITERHRPVYNVPANYMRQAAHWLQYMRDPLFTPDTVDIMMEDFLPTLKTPEAYAAQTSNLQDPTRILTMRDLGIDAVPVEKLAFEFLQAYRYGGHFYRVSGYH